MRAPIKATVLLAVMVLASFSVASGQSPVPAVYVDVAEVTGLTAEGYIPEAGTELVIPVRFINVDVRRTAISNGYKFVGDVTYTNLNAAWNAAYPWDWMMAMALGVFPPYFDQGLFINYFGADLYTAPTTEAIGAGMAGLTGAQGSGLPPDFNGIAYHFTLSGVSGTPGQVLTMDTTWWQPANYWLWTAVGGAVSWNGPIEFVVEGDEPPPVCEEVYTVCWPQPTILKALENDRILEFYVFCEENAEVVLSSIRVGNIPPYTGAAIKGDTLYTDAFIMRFLGASGFRPVPSEGIQSTYTLTYDKTDGSSVALTGDYVLSVYGADVNFDTEVNIADIVLLTDYLFNGGPKAMLFGEEMDEFMDVDGNGHFDLLDVQAAIGIAGL